MFNVENFKNYTILKCMKTHLVTKICTTGIHRN